MLVLWLKYIVVRPPRQRHWLLILTKNNSVAILTAVRITEHNGAYPKIMLIQDKQQEAAVDSALLGSQTNHGLTSHNGNFSTLCIHRILIIPAGLPDQRSAWFIGCLSVCIVWIAVLLCPSSFGTRVAAVVQQRSWLRCLPCLCRGRTGGKSLLEAADTVKFVFMSPFRGSAEFTGTYSNKGAPQKEA